MKQKIYSYTLVSLQFLCIAILLYTNDSIFSNIASLTIFSIGFIIGIYALLHNGLGNFNITPEIKDKAVLATHGVYRYIRHPMYLSVTLMMLGVIINNLHIFNITIFLLLILVLFLKAKKEEKLWSKNSKDYVLYKQKTRMIIPFLL